MGKSEFEIMNDNDFENMLENSVTDDLLPEEIVNNVTPWKKAMKRILWGIALSTVTFNFLYLNYILPAIGIMLSFFGYRALRCENKWFKMCFAVSAGRAAYFFSKLVLNTTIIKSYDIVFKILFVFDVAVSVLMVFEFFCLWRGLRAAQKKAGISVHCGSAFMLMLWYAVLCVLAFIGYSGFVIITVMLIGYIFIIVSVYRLSKTFDKVGYSFKTAFIKISNKCIVLILVLAVSVGGTIGYLFGGRYPMKWRKADMSEHDEVEGIKAHLTELGFPEYVLDDLSAEDIKSCDGALSVVVDNLDVWNREIADGMLEMVGIGVKVSDEPHKWIIFHHFIWTENPGFCGTESVHLWPVYQDISSGWISDGKISGRVLYDKDGETFIAPYHLLEETYLTYDTVLFGKQTRRDIYGSFSMPKKGNNRRGYVSYSVKGNSSADVIYSSMHYTHQKSRFQYPVMTAAEKRKMSERRISGVFYTVSLRIQFFTLTPDPSTLFG